MTSNTAPAVTSGQWSRLSGTLLSPVVTFRDIAQRPGWVLPILISTILSLAYTFEIGHHVGWERLIQYRIEHSSYASLPAGEQEALIQQQLPLTVLMGYLYSSIGTALEVLIVAGVLYVLFANGRLRFKQAFSIVSYAFLPGAFAALIGAVVIAVKRPEDIDPDRVLFFNAGAFVQSSSVPGWLSTILSSLDLFSAWMLLLVAIGFWVASRSKSFSFSFAKVLVAWMLWIGVRAALS